MQENGPSGQDTASAQGSQGVHFMIDTLILGFKQITEFSIFLQCIRVIKCLVDRDITETHSLDQSDSSSHLNL